MKDKWEQVMLKFRTFLRKIDKMVYKILDKLP